MPTVSGRLVGYSISATSCLNFSTLSAQYTNPSMSAFPVTWSRQNWQLCFAFINSLNFSIFSSIISTLIG